MFGRRPDATLVTHISTLRRFMPHVSPRRNDSLFYLMQTIEVDAALAFLEERNRHRPADRPMTLFHLLLRACSQALYLRPGVNRFVKGGRLWQRDGEWISFSAKREIKDGAPMITIKKRFYPTTETLDAMIEGIYQRLDDGRAGKKTTSDKEMSLMVRLPVFAIRLLMAVARAGDNLGLLPRSMIDADPLFTSVYLANLGSIQYPAGFHHLWEYGTTSLFGVMGKIEQRENGRRAITLAWTYDERIEDGLYSYYTLELIRQHLEDPERLLVTTGSPS